MNSAVQHADMRPSRPLVLRVLAVIWGFGTGSLIVSALRAPVRMAFSEWPSSLGSRGAALAWSGGTLALCALLIVACLALYYRRRSAARLFGSYLVVRLGVLGFHLSRHPEWASHPRTMAWLLSDPALNLFTLWYNAPLVRREARVGVA